jgi:hypothetical protein
LLSWSLSKAGLVWFEIVFISNRPSAATFKDGILSDEIASVRLKSACEKIAVSQKSNLVLACTENGIVPYQLSLTGDGADFIMPQV